MDMCFPDKRVELLSPAGDMECFKAAMCAGADAVYLAGGRFGARAYAKNFTEEEIIEAIRYAHHFGRKVHLTVNTVLKDDEIEELYDYLNPLVCAGLDAVIVQDIGVISYIRRNFPSLSVHASTQMAITDCEGIDFLDSFGVKRCVLARELSLDEIRNIHTHNDMELECFIHGALCYCYSGKCLMSSFIGGRSGNRGKCAQPCRLTYNDSYILSARDICALTILPGLIEAGIASFKIEGRMKSPDYVAGVTGIYRKYIDLYYSLRTKMTDKEASIEYGKRIEKEDLNELLTLYTRSGNSKGYYYQRNGRDMITIDKPGYMTADDDMKARVFEKYGKREPKIEVTLIISVHKNEPVTITARTSSGLSVTCAGPDVDEAKSRPTDKDTIEKQIMKTGGTPFAVAKVEIDCDSDCFIPMGVLNEMRRRVLNSLSDLIIEDYNRRVLKLGESAVKSAYIETDDKLSVANMPSGVNRPLIQAEVMTFEQFERLISGEVVDIIVINQDMILGCDTTASKLIGLSHEAGKKIYFRFPYIVRNGYLSDFPYLKELTEYDFDGAVVPNYESLQYLISMGYKGKIITDFYLYAMNREAYSVFRNTNEVDITTTLPLELNRHEIISRDVVDENIIAYGRIPLMVSAQCVEKTCHGCKKEPGKRMIRDRMNLSFPVYNNCGNCLNVIYNSVPLSLHKDADLFSRMKANSIRLIYTDEDGILTEKVAEYYECVLNGDNMKDVIFPVKDYTRGHLNRGV